MELDEWQDYLRTIKRYNFKNSQRTRYKRNENGYHHMRAMWSVLSGGAIRFTLLALEKTLSILNDDIYMCQVLITKLFSTLPTLTAVLA